MIFGKTLLKAYEKHVAFQAISKRLPHCNNNLKRSLPRDFSTDRNVLLHSLFSILFFRNICWGQNCRLQQYRGSNKMWTSTYAWFLKKQCKNRWTSKQIVRHKSLLQYTVRQPIHRTRPPADSAGRSTNILTCSKTRQTVIVAICTVVYTGKIISLASIPFDWLKR